MQVGRKLASMYTLKGLFSATVFGIGCIFNEALSSLFVCSTKHPILVFVNQVIV